MFLDVAKRSNILLVKRLNLKCWTNNVWLLGQGLKLRFSHIFNFSTDGLAQHLYHFTPKKIFAEFGGSATFTIEKVLDLPILDIVTENLDDYTVASIIVNKTVAREHELQTAGFVECAEQIAENLFKKMDIHGVKQKWKKTKIQFGSKEYKLVTTQAILPKWQSFFPYSFNDAKNCGHV